MFQKSRTIHIIGAGLAGSEAAYFLASHGHKVKLFEMRPHRMTPAHQTEYCAELVCSNSFKSQNPLSAPGILKQEMSALGSFILKAAQKAAVPAGEALGVDRTLFSEIVTTGIKQHPNIECINQEIDGPTLSSFEEAPTIIATGPLTSDRLGQWLQELSGEQYCYFYDAIAPIVSADSIQWQDVFVANRYNKSEEAAYVNCPLNKEQYEAFIDALLSADKVTLHPFEEEKYFAGCSPIEHLCSTGRQTLRFGPMKPVGLIDPKTGKEPYAAVQLRPENRSKTAYNLVGFQTKCSYQSQKEIFKKIPGLQEAEFLRLGSIHRNTYVCGPQLLNRDLSLKSSPHIRLAGQITGVEGYLESAACGLLSALFLHQTLTRGTITLPPPQMALGALLQYITQSPVKNYQPTNMHYGLFDTWKADHPLYEGKLKGLGKKERKLKMAELVLEESKKSLTEWKNDVFKTEISINA